MERLVARRRGATAKRERRRSRTQFERLGRRAALRVAAAGFPGSIGAPAYEGLHLQAGERLDRYLSERSALIDLPDSPERAIAQSTIPIAVEQPAHQFTPIDLTSVEHDGRYEPRSSTVATQIGDTAAVGIAFPDAGVSVRPVVASDSAGELVNGRAFYANVAPDTDLVAEAAPLGAETLTELRSANSPEDVAFDVALPAGATLQLAVGPGGFPDGVQVVRDGRVFASIPPATAVDADGFAVPVSYSVSGSRLTLHVPHRGGDYRYPIEVDPTFYVNNNDPSFSDINGWTTFRSNSLYAFPYSAGSYIGIQQNAGWYQNTDYGNWVWFPGYSSVPSNPLSPSSGAYLYRADFEYINYPFNYQCINTGIWVPASDAWDNSGTDYQQTCAGMSSQYITVCAVSGCGPNYGTDNNEMLYGMEDPPTNPNNPALYTGSSLSTMRGADMLERDRHSPSVTSVSSNAPSGTWINARTLSAAPSATDVGLGLYSFSLMIDQPANGTAAQTHSYTDLSGNPLCGGDRNSPCPTSWNSQFYYNSGSLSDGSHQIGITATDIVGNVSAEYGVANIEVDNNPPTLSSTSGSLWDARGGTISSDSSVSATVADSYSGVASADVLVDGVKQGAATSPSSCGGASSCTVNYTLPIDRMPEGTHTIAITATDKANNSTTYQSWQVTVKRTDMGQQHGYGFDWQDINATSDIEVNVANGSAFLRSRDLNFAQDQIDLPFERYFNTLWLGHKGSFGWQSTANVGPDTTLASGGGAATLSFGDGSTVVFSQLSDGSYAAPSDVDMTLAANTDGSYDLTDDNGLGYHFVGGRVVTITDAAGATVSLTYATSGALASIQDSTTGKVTTFTTAASGDITQISQGGSTYSYKYGGPDGKYLTSATDPSGHPTSYSYDANNRLSRISPPDSTYWQLTYDALNRVTSLQHVTNTTTATGPATTYSYSTGSSLVTQPDGQVLTYSLDSLLNVTGTSANPLPADYQACVAMEDPMEDPIEAQLYCESNNRDVEVASPDGPVYDPSQPALGNVTDFSSCYAEFSSTDAACHRASVPDEQQALLPTIGAHAFSIGIADDARIVNPNDPADQPDGASNEDSKWFADLNTKIVRAVVPYDIYYDHHIERTYTDSNGNTVKVSYRGEFSRWYHRVYGAHGDQVMVSFECKLRVHHSGCSSHLPSEPEYTKDIRRFMSTYSGVQIYSAWNEPNSGAQPTNFKTKTRHRAGGPERAARYTATLEKSCQANLDAGHNCVVVAADMTDRTPDAPLGNGGAKSNDAYEQRYSSALGSGPPIVWALHPYIDLNRNSDPTSTNAQAGSNTLDTQAFINHAPPNSQIWLDEIGAWYEGPSQNTQQAGRTNFLFATLANISSQIERVNYYGFFTPLTPSTFDTELVKPGVNGSPNEADASTARYAWYQVGCRANPTDMAHYPSGCPAGGANGYAPSGSTSP